jgi:hypothetical protein
MADLIDHAIVFFPYAVRHDFNHATRRAVTLMQAIGEDEMKSQIEYYHTDGDNGTCGCRQLVHYSAMFNQRVPCCHLLAADFPRPRMQSRRVLLGAVKDGVADSFTYNLEMALREAEPPRLGRRETLKEIAAHHIKRQSKTEKKLDVVRAWVE